MAKDNIKIRSKNRMIFLLVSSCVLLILLIIKTAWIQIVDSEWLQKKAYESQTRDRTISSKRGTIYSSDNNVLAKSYSVETVKVIPAQVKNQAEMAQKLSEILGLEYQETYDKICKKQSEVTIKKDVDKEKTDLIREWIIETDSNGIKIDESVKRFYPNNNLASHVLGFYGTDKGLYGIEKSYDDVLTGTPGRIISETDGRGNDIPFSSEDYYAAQDGNDIVLSIDSSIQYFAEKHLEQAVIDNQCEQGGVAIVMKPTTGDVLAMAVKPDFDLNSPFGPYNEEQLLIWDTIPTDEKKEIRESMWRNMAISDTYEPGSTFKVITASAALDSGVYTKDAQFTCTGSITIGGARMKCWRYYRPHGLQTMTQTLENSCNPAFISMGVTIGKETLRKYIDAFGFTEKTGIELPGEASGVFHNIQMMGDTEVATTAFGQRFNITPIELVTAVSAIANDGKIMQPRIVKEIRDNPLYHDNIKFYLGHLIGYCGNLNYMSLEEYENSEMDFASFLCETIKPKEPKKIWCGQFTMSSICIGPNGEMYKCEHDFGVKDRIIGTVTDGFFFNEHLMSFLEQPYPQECRDCSIFPICLGGCPSARFLSGENKHCEYTKNYLMKIIENYITNKRR